MFRLLNRYSFKLIQIVAINNDDVLDIEIKQRNASQTIDYKRIKKMVKFKANPKKLN